MNRVHERWGVHTRAAHSVCQPPRCFALALPSCFTGPGASFSFTSAPETPGISRSSRDSAPRSPLRSISKAQLLQRPAARAALLQDGLPWPAPSNSMAESNSSPDSMDDPMPSGQPAMPCYALLTPIEVIGIPDPVVHDEVGPTQDVQHDGRAPLGHVAQEPCPGFVKAMIAEQSLKTLRGDPAEAPVATQETCNLQVMICQDCLVLGYDFQPRVDYKACSPCKNAGAITAMPLLPGFFTS